MNNLDGYKELLKYIVEAKYTALKNYVPIEKSEKPILVRGGWSKRKYFICTCGKNSGIHLTRQTGLVEGLHWVCPKCKRDNIVNSY